MRSWPPIALLLAACPAADPALPGEPQPYDVEAYALRGEYDWEQSLLNAAVVITVKLDDPGTPGAIVLDSEVDVTAVHADGRPLQYVADPELGTLQIDLTGITADPARITIEYTAATSEALRAWDGREGDPVTTRAVYSFSEPLDVPRWMPCQNRPDDRARFSVEMRMRKDEALISNGSLELDEADAEQDSRRMRWATDYTLPPYLMAFAVGPFAVAGGDHDGVDIGTWYRPGLDGAFDLIVAELDRMLGVFEAKLGPYPFEKYQLVLLPAVGGGIEHASITFQTETSSNQPAIVGDLQLTAHELAHQWWGDYVTVATWDDVWIKEGFATMLSTEPLRRDEDRSNAGTFMGDWHSASASAAIRDPALLPPDKYTSGPYGRAAWLLTQIRGTLGDEEFFKVVRDLLAEHAEGAIGTEDMIAAFEPLLGESATFRMRQAIDTHELPRIDVALDGDGVRLDLSDPQATLVAPIQFEWRRASGDVERVTLEPAAELTLAKNDPGDLLVIDPDDLHIRLSLLIPGDDSYANYYGALLPMLLPEGHGAVAAFSALPGPHQRFALLYAGLPNIAPDEFPDLMAGLHSETARSVAPRVACIAAALLEDPEQQAAWSPVLTEVFINDPPLAGIGGVGSYTECTAFVDPLAMFADDWPALASGLKTPAIDYPRLVFLSRFDLPLSDAHDVWPAVARDGHSLRVRGLAAAKISNIVGTLDLEDSAAVAPWRAVVLELLASHEAGEVLSPMIASAISLDGSVAANAEFLDVFADILHNADTWPVHARTLCGAALLIHEPSDWDAFVARLGEAPLSQDALDILADPSQCL